MHSLYSLRSDSIDRVRALALDIHLSRVQLKEHDPESRLDLISLLESSSNFQIDRFVFCDVTLDRVESLIKPFPKSNCDSFPVAADRIGVSYHETVTLLVVILTTGL